MEPVYLPLHRRWVILNPERPELIIASGNTKDETLRALAHYKKGGIDGAKSSRSK